jgi:hypothetical protein
VRVTVRLLGPDGPVDGDAFIRSELIETTPCPAGQPTCEDAKAQASLRLETWARTIQGTFSVQLPRGKYELILTPTGDGRLGKAIRPTTVAGSNDLQITMPQLQRLRGRALVTNDLPLGEATIEARPAARWLAQPDKYPTARWPRPATTRTNDQGEFILPLDEGEYDLFVKPAVGSRLPWLVKTSTLVTLSDRVTDLEDPIRVPAPFHQSYALRDPNGSAVDAAIVRAFATIQGTRIVIETGRALTDASGRFDLYLAPAPR